MAFDEARDEVWALVGREVARPGDKPLVVGQLQRLCRAAATALPAMGVGISVMADLGGQVSVAASSEVNEKIEELQFILGEGPCLDAYDSGGPVMMPDLAAASRARWPGYGPAAQDFGVRAVFAFPLQAGAARLGALDVYQDRAGSLAGGAISQALNFADLAMQTLLDARLDTDAEEPAPADDALGGRLELYQAQGMVMIQLGIGLTEAMSRLRAYAYAYDRGLNDVAADIVARKLVLEGDSE